VTDGWDDISIAAIIEANNRQHTWHHHICLVILPAGSGNHGLLEVSESSAAG